MTFKKIYLTALVLIFVSLIFYACPKKNSPGSSAYKNLDRYPLISKFSHKAHKNVLKKERIICSNCHSMQISLENQPRNKRADLSGELLYPGMEECHYCHNNDKYEGNAPKECLTCHKDLGGMLPDNHKIDWLNRHKMISKLEKSECSKCHQDSYCTDCHLKRDTIRQRVHDRNFLYAHSVEARSNPRKCVSCHTAAYCLSCHTERGITQ